MRKTKKQKWIDRISKILIIMALLFNTNMIIPAPAEAAVVIQTSLAKVYMDDLQIGGAYRLSEVSNGTYLTATNKGEPVDIEVVVYGTESFTEADEGYEVIPDSSWIVADPSYFTDVDTNETIQTDAVVTIPDDPQYLGKSYQAKVFYMPRNFGGIAGGTVITKFYFSISTSSGDTTPPAAPTNVSVADAGTGGKLNLSWTNPTDTDFSHIHIYRSTASGQLGGLVYDDITGTTQSDTGLTDGLTYYYTLRSVDTSNNESTNTDQYSGTPTAVGDTAPPEIGSNSFAVGNIFLANKKVKVETNVSDNNQVTLARVYYRKTGETSYSNTSFTPDPDGSETYSGTAYIPEEAVTTAGFEYYIEAYDGTNYSYWASASSPEKINVGKTTIRVFGVNNVISVIDGETQTVVATLNIPANALSGETEISVEQLDVTSLPDNGGLSKSSDSVIAFEFGPHGLQFNGQISVKISYSDSDSDGLVDGTNINENELALFYYDGFEWRYLGGTVDVANNAVTTQINHFSTFALFPAKDLAASDYRPARKIITPNGDGTNDAAYFSGLSTEVKIFDITGKKIRTVAAGVGQWDGKDDDGDVVRNGVYIYQFEAEGTLVSGTIAVAK